MINNIIEEYGLYICIGLALLVLLVFIILIVRNRKHKKKSENNSSILDINIDGVVDKDFEYGYEKEDTFVMKPVQKDNDNKKKKNTKKKK